MHYCSCPIPHYEWDTIIKFGKGGNQNHGHSHLENLSDEEVWAGARNKNIPKEERRKYVEEEKDRRKRNKKKREKK